MCEGLTVSNGFSVYSESSVNGKYLPDTLAYFNCNDGYQKIGPYGRKCLDDGTWDRQVQRCKKGNDIFYLISTKRN